MSKLNSSSRHKSYLVFAILLALYEIATYLSNDAYLPALPFIVSDLNTSNHLIQLTLTSWFLGSSSIQLFLGPLTDRIGRRPVLLVGGLIFIGSTLGCALTNDVYVLLLMRFIQGAAIASMFVPGYATIHELFEQKQAIHILAIMSSITILAPAFGPLLGAVVLYFTDWRWIFGLLALWAIIAVGGLFFKMPETRAVNPDEINIKKIIRQYKNIVSNKSFMSLALNAQCFFASMIAWIAAGPFLLIDRFHFSTLSFGIIQGVVFTGFIIATRVVKHLMDKFDLHVIIKFGTGLAIIGAIYAVITSLIFPNILWNMVIAMMLIAGGTGLAFPILNRLSMKPVVNQWVHG